jgi:small conductance mechanosensitive channel
MDPVGDVTRTTNTLLSWLSGNWPWFAIAGVGLLLVWRYARRLIRTALTGILRAQAHALEGAAVPEEELAKRVATVEQLLASGLRLVLVAAFVFVVFGMLRLWPALTSLGLLGAALAVAGQNLILDYLMGIVILLEGQYYTGDTVAIGDVEGVVEEVGIRRTVLRDSSGTVHSISNGLIRSSSNLTRVFAAAIVDVQGIRDGDVEQAIEVLDRVGQELAADPAWRERILEAPRYLETTALTDTGVTLRMTGKVRAAHRWSVPAELRRRLALALPADGIELDRRALAPPPDAEPGRR